MSIPDFQAIMLPLLQELQDGHERSMNDVIEILEDHFELTAEERAEMQPSGTLRLFQNRAHWAKFHLKKAGLIENPRRGVVSLSESGRDVLATSPKHVDITLLKQFEPYQRFRAQQRSPDDAELSELKESQLAPPYDQLFGDFSNANSVLDRFADVLRTLQCDAETQDIRVSIGLPAFHASLSAKCLSSEQVETRWLGRRRRHTPLPSCRTRLQLPLSAPGPRGSSMQY